MKGRDRGRFSVVPWSDVAEAMEPRLSEPSESELFRRYLDGDREAMVVLFQRFETRVFAFCRRMLGSDEDAEDALQETFLRVSRQRSFDGEKVSSWIYRIALNLCRNHLQSRNARLRRETQSIEGDDGQPVPSPAEVYLDHVREQEIADALDRLPEIYREPLILKYIEDMSRKEMSEILGVPVTTIEGRLKTGRERLRRMLARGRE
jgi:RNA polymerase sigma-70 factor (ECF subfamily)